MALTERTLEKIYSYIAGKMAADEKQEFESLIESDPELAENLEFYKQVRPYLSQINQDNETYIKGLAAQVLQETEPIPIPIWSRPSFWAIAATVALIAVAAYFFLGSEITNSSEGKYAEAISVDSANLYILNKTATSGMGNEVRSLLRQGRAKEALAILDSIPEDIIQKQSYDYYLFKGMALSKQGQESEARKSWEIILSEEGKNSDNRLCDIARLTFHSLRRENDISGLAEFKPKWEKLNRCKSLGEESIDIQFTLDHLEGL